MPSTMPALNNKVIIRPEVDADQKYSGIVFTVVEHLRTNIVIEATGPGKELLSHDRVRVNPKYVTPAPDGYDQHTTATAQLVPIQSPLSVGEVCTAVPDSLRGVDESTLLVVIGFSGRVAYQVAPLGGDSGRVFKNVARAALNPIPLQEVGERLTA
jgi:hypothetical protein